MPCEPVWPLPRRAGGASDEEIREAFDRFEGGWHYLHEFEGGLRLEHNTYGRAHQTADRPLQRFRHFMPYVLAACGGSLEGKRVLDIACNSGFFSIQCALMGAEVVGFDGRSDLIERADLLKDIVGAERARFHTRDFWSMSPDELGGKFDVVLFLGIFYHLASPIPALQLVREMSSDVILLNTMVHNVPEPDIRLRWEGTSDIRTATHAGVVAKCSRKAVELILRHIGFSSWSELPVEADMPSDYVDGRVASWLIRV